MADEKTAVEGSGAGGSLGTRCLPHEHNHPPDLVEKATVTLIRQVGMLAEEATPPKKRLRRLPLSGPDLAAQRLVVVQLLSEQMTSPPPNAPCATS